MPLLTLKEAAATLKVSLRTLQRLVARQQIEVVRPAGLNVVRVRPSEVERLIQEGAIAPARYWKEAGR